MYFNLLMMNLFVRNMKRKVQLKQIKEIKCASCWSFSHIYCTMKTVLKMYFKKTENKTLAQNNYQQDDTYGLSFISRLVVLHSTCFELQEAHHQEFTFFLYRQSLTYCVIFCCIHPFSYLFCSWLGNRTRRRTGEYSKRLHSMSETACTEKKWTPDDELPEVRNM